MSPSTRKRGELEVVHGSMFGGKTEHTIAQLYRARESGLCVRAFKHQIDDRYDVNHLVTHRRESFDAVRVKNAAAILDQIEGVDLVAIDEGHFFKMALVPVVEEILARGVSVIVAGITHDAWGRPFEPMPQLCTIADCVVVKNAPCRICGTSAPYTQRMTEVNTEHMVGGLDDYEPRCKAHFKPLSIPPEVRG